VLSLRLGLSAINTIRSDDFFAPKQKKENLMRYCKLLFSLLLSVSSQDTAGTANITRAAVAAKVPLVYVNRRL
jgi:hypothetical protein